MVRTALAFLAGVLLLQQLPALPPGWLVLPLLATGFLVARIWPLPLLVIGGFLWSWWCAQGVLAERLPEALAGQDLVVTGVVSDLPRHRGDSQRFLFDVREARIPVSTSREVAWRGRARLAWRTPTRPVRGGEPLKLRVRLYPPGGFRNPGGFDYERWLFSNRLGATGYVVSGLEDLSGDPRPGALHQRLRESVRTRVDMASGPSPGRALFNALVVGDRSGFGDAHWEVFRKTGTSHLVAISGLHLGLLAGLAYFLAERSWRRSEWLCRRWPSQIAGAIFALVAASGYALLAGFSLPTQRALIMLAFATGALVFRRNVRPVDVLALALVAVLLFDPAAVLSAGFWLSFGAVGVIFMVLPAPGVRTPLWAGWVRVQLAISIGLVPVMAAWGLPLSAVAPAVNLLAVPWFTVVVVPLSMLATLVAALLPTAGQPLLRVVVVLLDHTWAVLAWIAQAGAWTWSPGPAPLWALLFAVAGALVLLLPVRWMLRGWGLVLMLPLVLPHGHVMPQGALRVAVLDVGQGLAVVVRTARHTLVYDLGPGYASGFNTAETVVIPFLESRGVRRVDRLVLSHDDVDHAGATDRFVAGMPVGDILSGQPRAVGEGALACRAGMQWNWDGVQFEVLHPRAGEQPGNDNDASCVLRIAHAGGSILLTGDITRRVERLLADGIRLPATDYVVVPHHGSRTSSSAWLVNAVRARYALVSAGYKNRYGFPHAEVSERWRRSGATVLNTAESGALMIALDDDGTSTLARFREERRRYWHR